MHICVPIIIDVVFLQHIQDRMCIPSHVNVLQWSWECFSFRHIKLNSRLDVMTINVLPFDRPNIVTGFSVIHSFVCWLRPVRTSSKVCSEHVAAHKLVPHWSGFSDSTISSRQFYCALCDWEYDVFTTRRCHFPRIDSSSMDFRRVQIFQLLIVCDHSVSCQFPPAHNA